MRCFVCQRYNNGGRRGSFYFLVHERKTEKRITFLFEKNADSSLGRKEEILTTLIKREELERKEEEERESLAILR